MTSVANSGGRAVLRSELVGVPRAFGMGHSFNLRRAKGIRRYHHQFGPFRAMSHNPSLSWCRPRKLATPIDLASERLTSLQVDALERSWPSLRVHSAVA